MRLTTHTDYALRALLYLGAPPSDLATVGEIAEAYKISKNHLVKVVNGLARLGYVETIRGHSGGVRLARAPAAINLGEIVRRMEPDFDLVECFDRSTNACLIAHECSLKGPLSAAQRAFLNALDQYTLQDLLKRPGMTAQLTKLRT